METASFIIALWGAILSTILGIIAVRKNRLHIIADLETFPADNDMEIHVTNLSQRTIIVYYYNLYYKGKPKKYLDVELYWTEILPIPSNSVKKIMISEHLIGEFNKKEKLYMELYIKGRKKPKTICIA